MVAQNFGSFFEVFDYGTMSINDEWQNNFWTPTPTHHLNAWQSLLVSNFVWQIAFEQHIHEVS